MADFVLLSRTAEFELVGALHRAIQERDNAFLTEIRAVLALQRQARRLSAYKRFKEQKEACERISRMFRGFKGRQVFAEKQRQARRREVECLFHSYALSIQQVFRGFFSRKYRHDFYARKAYIKLILDRSDKLRLELSINREKVAQEEQERRLKKMQQEFKNIAKGLHHLLSTKTRPGVYNAPFAPNGPPTAFGRPVEEHLREFTKEMLLNEGQRAERRRKKRIKTSVRAGCEYESHKNAQRDEERRFKALRISEKNFCSTVRGTIGTEHVEPISISSFYIDPWKIRLSGRERKTSPGHNKRPLFQTALRKNQLFDEIADEFEGQIEKEEAFQNLST